MYNYEEAMKADITEYLADNEYYLTGYDREELEEKLNEDLWTCDRVTGNGSGSYTFCREDAKQYVSDDGLDYLREAAKEFDCVQDLLDHFLDDDYEYLDVTIRCYLLARIISEVLDEAEKHGYFQEEDDEDVC